MLHKYPNNIQQMPSSASPLLLSHPRVPLVVLVLLHEFVVEFLETVHDRRHVLLRRQDGGSQMENPTFKQDKRPVSITGDFKRRKCGARTLPFARSQNLGRWRCLWLLGA